MAESKERVVEFPTDFTNKLNGFSFDFGKIYYRLHSLAKQADNALGSVLPSICLSGRPSIYALTTELFDIPMRFSVRKLVIMSRETM